MVWLTLGLGGLIGAICGASLFWYLAGKPHELLETSAAITASATTSVGDCGE
jgi:hypothetical protein